MSFASTLSDDSSVLAPDSPLSQAMLDSREPHYEYQTFERPSSGEGAGPEGLLMVAVWMVVLPLLLAALYICIDLFRRQL